VVLLVALIVTIGTIVAGCLLARKAGAGSREALVWLLLILGVELLLVVQVLRVNGYLPAIVLGGAMLVQVALFLTSRNGRPPAAP
jgi:hypothetical protein